MTITPVSLFLIYLRRALPVQLVACFATPALEPQLLTADDPPASRRSHKPQPDVQPTLLRTSRRFAGAELSRRCRAVQASQAGLGLGLVTVTVTTFWATRDVTNVTELTQRPEGEIRERAQRGQPWTRGSHGWRTERRMLPFLKRGPTRAKMRPTRASSPAAFRLLTFFSTRLEIGSRCEYTA